MPRSARPARFAALIASAIGLAAPAPAQESVVAIDTPAGPLAGTLVIAPDAPGPAVLLLHGFTGSRDEIAVAGTGEGLFTRTARLLAGGGVSSLRIDFRGSGDSPGRFADTSFEGQTADALAALDWLARQPGIDPDRIAVLGWSQGGLVATAVAGRTGGRIAALILWAAIADPVETFGGILGADALARGMAGQTVTAAGATLGPGFFAGIASFRPTGEIAAYAGPLFLAHGTSDRVVLPHAADRLAAAHPGPVERWSAPADHAFNASRGPETPDRLIAATLAFLLDLGF